jgi:hypothetical protein
VTHARRLEILQARVVLYYFAARELSDHDFTSALKLLAESSQRIGRPGLAGAASDILHDWQARAQSVSTTRLRLAAVV